MTKTKEGNKWVVRSKTGKNLGTFETEAAADKHLRRVEFFKHQDKKEKGGKR